MKNLSMPLPSDLSKECDNSTNQRLASYATERADLLFGCYRRGEANDPETYCAAVAAVLAEYPEETIRYVTDPRSGLPSRVHWMPTVGEVRQACESHYGPMRRAMEREAAERRQLAERKTLAIPDCRPRKTYEELIADCQARGLNVGPKKPAVETIDSFLAAHNVTRKQFDAIPDLPDDFGISAQRST